MINGNVYKFIDYIAYGEELWFIYKGTKYFLEGLTLDGMTKLYLFEMVEGGAEYSWPYDEINKRYPVDAFLRAQIWDRKTFWEVEQEIEWVDC